MQDGTSSVDDAIDRATSALDTERMSCANMLSQQHRSHRVPAADLRSSQTVSVRTVDKPSELAVVFVEGATECEPRARDVVVENYSRISKSFKSAHQ